MTQTAEQQALEIIESIERDQTFRGFPVFELRQIFNAYESPEGWKEGNRVVIAPELVTRLHAAVAYFLADDAVIEQRYLGGPIEMSWEGYKA